LRNWEYPFYSGGVAPRPPSQDWRGFSSRNTCIGAEKLTRVSASRAAATADRLWEVIRPARSYLTTELYE